MNWYLKVVKENYANFEGRARRKEYWMFTLMNFVITLVLYIPFVFGLAFESQLLTAIAGGLILIFLIAMIIPTLAVMVRRLHDTGNSGGMYFVSFIPFIGGIWLLVLMTIEGDTHANKYGANPKLEPEDWTPI